MTTIIMGRDSLQCPPRKSLDLHLAALDGNYEWVRNALASGADVNSVDEMGRNVLMCAIAGHDWNNLQISIDKHNTPERFHIIRLLVAARSDITLATLNAPQDACNGVTPLGMASWLNMRDVVSFMLEESYGMVAVDALDTHGATPLMYAARDGNLEVLKVLCHRGARPDLRDRNHWSSIQYSLPHPEALYTCEAALRLHRLRESKLCTSTIFSPQQWDSIKEYSLSSLQPVHAIPLPAFASETTSRITDTLVKTVTSPDIPFLCSLLFSFYDSQTPKESPQTLVALPVLVNRPDSRGWSPIHYCTSALGPSITILDMLYCAGADVGLFTNAEHYTPLHCLARFAHPAEKAESTLTLYQFIIHLVQDLRAPLAARDLHDETPIHLAAEHGSCLELLLALLDCDTTGTIREMRNERGLTPLEVSKPEFRIAFAESAGTVRSASALSNHTIRPADSLGSLASLVNWNVRRLGGTSSPVPDPVEDVNVSQVIPRLLSLLRSTSPANAGQTSLEALQDMVTDASKLSANLLAYCRKRAEELTQDLSGLRSRSRRLSSLKENVQDLGDEQLKEQKLTPLAPRKLNRRESEDSQATAVSTSTSAFSSKTSLSPSTSQRNHVSTQTDCGQKPIQRKRSGTLVQWFESLRLTGAHLPPLQIDPIIVTRKDKKLKGWFKTKLVQEPQPLKYTIVKELDDKSSAVGREVKGEHPSLSDPAKSMGSVDYSLRTSPHVLSAVAKELTSIEDRAALAERVIGDIEQWIGRVERVTHRALKSRLSFINSKINANLNKHLSHQSSTSSLLSSLSSGSVPLSPIENDDDEDTRTIRRLLLRKIEAKTQYTYAELDRVNSWLHVIQDIVQGVKRRAYLY